MEKRFLGSIAIFAIAVIAAWNVTQSQNEMALSDVALENVEALAWEIRDSFPVTTNPDFSIIKFKL
ncbi:MAG: NVEALA domain-containing protein [Bacteroidales bacterium]|jgi:uncharacterized Rmd1/YagE family protein|nr:NVEALA domain-containing protein [Bacteroidales bacterium]